MSAVGPARRGRRVSATPEAMRQVLVARLADEMRTGLRLLRIDRPHLDARSCLCERWVFGLSLEDACRGFNAPDRGRVTIQAIGYADFEPSAMAYPTLSAQHAFEQFLLGRPDASHFQAYDVMNRTWEPLGARPPASAAVQPLAFASVQSPARKWAREEVEARIARAFGGAIPSRSSADALIDALIEVRRQHGADVPIAVQLLKVKREALKDAVDACLETLPKDSNLHGALRAGRDAIDGFEPR